MTLEWRPELSEGTSILQIRDESILDRRYNNNKTQKCFLVYSETNGNSVKEVERTEAARGKCID